ncbi:AGAP005887-PA-like protein [Anopheles sinensis]|uniref:AGAP005887-PA-like protein n=1 Tax=Anopheles sinensis TaxID=74873 RepID=A0A084W2R6_ANOSI|nr:AGAP005887-PA-like protein [Anopheles sinensis]
MGGYYHPFLPILVLALVGQGSSAPQGDITAEYPNGAFNDPVPNNENNQKFQEYASFLTRFDEWVTGKKVPIPADPATDALHQELPPDAPDFSTVAARVARAPAPFDDPVPQGSEAIPAYNAYISELTRFDPAVNGDGHAVFKREDTTEKGLISKDKDFGEHIEDKVPEATVSDPAYGDFIKELKRFDPYLVGHEVEIPHNATADQVWNSGAGKQ